jgi:hypothetical protein
VLTYADDRGRDAFAFQPIESRYLEVADDLRIRTTGGMDFISIGYWRRAFAWAYVRTKDE